MLTPLSLMAVSISTFFALSSAKDPAIVFHVRLSDLLVLTLTTRLLFAMPCKLTDLGINGTAQNNSVSDLLIKLLPLSIKLTSN